MVTIFRNRKKIKKIEVTNVKQRTLWAITSRPKDRMEHKTAFHCHSTYTVLQRKTILTQQ